MYKPPERYSRQQEGEWRDEHARLVEKGKELARVLPKEVIELLMVLATDLRQKELRDGDTEEHGTRWERSLEVVAAALDAHDN